MLFFLVTAWLLLALPCAVLVGRAIALGNRNAGLVPDPYPLDLPTQGHQAQPALTRLSA